MMNDIVSSLVQLIIIRFQLFYRVNTYAVDCDTLMCEKDRVDRKPFVPQGTRTTLGDIRKDLWNKILKFQEMLQGYTVPNFRLPTQMNVD